MKHFKLLSAVFCIIMLVTVPLLYSEEFPSEIGHEPSNQIITNLDRTEIDMKAPALVTEPIFNDLIKMTLEEKLNSEIELDLGPDANPSALSVADEIKTLWNSQRYDESLAKYGELESLTDVNKICMGKSLHNPVPTPMDAQPADITSDARIGTEDSVYITALDIHRASNKLFAVLLYRVGSNYYWAVYYSANGGFSWVNTYIWGEPWYIYTMSAKVVADHLYVCYSNGTDQNYVRCFRFRVSDGQRDNFSGGYSYITAYSTMAPDYIKEVALTTNQESWNNRLYLAIIMSVGDLRFIWDDPEAVSWTSVSTGVLSADEGIDITFNDPVSAFGTYWLFSSYIDNHDSLCIDGLDYSDNWTRVKRYHIGPYAHETSIGAYDDTATCFYEYTGLTKYCRYTASYDGGASWFWGVATDTTVLAECPDVTMRDGAGVGAVFRYYTSPREGRFTWRNKRGSESWTYCDCYTEYEPYYNKPSLEYLFNGLYGVVYLSWNSPYKQAAYFNIFHHCCRDIYRGNVNGDAAESLNISDITYLVAYCFGGGPAPKCIEEGNVNGDGSEALNISDITYLVSYCFGGGPLPEICPGVI